MAALRTLFGLLVVGGCHGDAERPPASPPDDPTLVIPALASSAAGTPELPVAATDEAAIDGITFPARDPRRTNRKPRSRTAMVDEIQDLERRVGALSAASVDRPTLRLRLADTYCELAYTSDGKSATEARTKALREYSAIKSESPTFPALDEALYYAGLAHEENGDLRNARASYFDLIKTSPASKLVPLAYFAFGEMFFQEAAADESKYDLAEQAFLEALKTPPARNLIYPESLLRLGEVNLHQKNETKARASFTRLRREFPGSLAVSRIPRGS